MKRYLVIGLVVLVTILVACVETDEEDSREPSTQENIVRPTVNSVPTVRPVNRSSVAACREHLSLVSDISKGILTIPEMRKRYKTINDRAYDASPKIKRATEGMLRGITAVDLPYVTTHAWTMTEACIEVLK